MFRQIIKLLFRGLADLSLHPWAQFFTIVAVTLVSFLAGFFLLVAHNINLELVKNKGEAQFQVYWKPGTMAEIYKPQWEDLANMKGLKEMKTFTPDQALDDLSQSLGGATDFEKLEQQSPLPPTAQLFIQFPPGEPNKAPQEDGWATKLLRTLRAMPEVETVHYNPLQSELADNWLSISRRVVWPSIVLLGLIVAMIVGNTIKLNLLTRKDEVEILSLVGARDWFIRVPLLSSGAAVGVCGSLFALAGLKGMQVWLKDALNFPPFLLKIQFLPWEQALALAGVVSVVAVISSWVAVR